LADAALLAFVQESLRTGASREETESILLDAGWSRDQIRGALGAYAAVDFPVPVPVPRTQVSARDAFLYLVMFGMLYLSAYNLGSLVFQFIDLAFPDPLLQQYGDLVGGRVRFATSSLLVAYPVFLFVAWRIERRISADPTQRTSGVRKWLTYLTLFIAAFVILGDVIALLNGLLSGSLSVRFLLKALTVGILAAAVFGYYLWSMRADDEALNR
jgi:hypothetical protein